MNRNEERKMFTSLDERIKQTNVDVIHCLNNTNPDAKREFLADSSILVPRNEYGNLNYETIQKNIEILSQMQSQLSCMNMNEKHRLLYDMVVEDHIRKNQFLYANYHVNQSRSKDNLENEYVSLHKKINHELYGMVDETVFRAIMHSKLSKINVDALNAAEAAEYDELLSVFEPVNGVELDCFIPRESTFNEFSRLMRIFLENVIRHIPTEERAFKVQEVCDITNEILVEEFAISDSDWSALVEPDRVSAATSQEKRQILYPGKRSRGDYSGEDVLAIIAHELCVHAMRSIPYRECKMTSFSMGFPNYETFEEGIAKAVEQAVVGKYQMPGLLHYVSVGLAEILHKNFRETYEIQVKLEHLTGGVSESQCFDSVQRAFRGTGLLPNNKDLVYFNGSNTVWKYIEEHINDPLYLLEQLFLSGKTDATEEKHLWLVYEMRHGGL